MKRSLLLAVACIAALFVSLSPAADSAAKKLFTVKLKITETKDGQTQTIAEPVLVVSEGVEASFQTGGEIVSVDDETVPAFGLLAKITLREAAEGKVKVAMLVCNNEWKPVDKSEYTVLQTGARCWKTVKRGEASTFDMGDGRQATLVVYSNGTN